LIHCGIILEFRIECKADGDLSVQIAGVPSIPQAHRRSAMFQKKSQNTYFSAAVATGLVATLAVVVATLVDAVAGMQSFL
jgi:hypothetical protein